MAGAGDSRQAFGKPAGTAADEIITPASFQPLTHDVGKAAAERPSKVRPVLIASLALFLLALGFLFTARSLQILVLAETEATVSVSGLALPFGERYLLMPGDYTVTARAPGYEPFASDITVEARDSQSIELVLQPLPGRLDIETEPPGATVNLDGEVVGKTPLKGLSVAAGVRELSLTHPRYLGYQQTLRVTGRSMLQSVAARLEPAWANVSIDSEPAGASILVDGEAVGTTPAIAELLEGERQLMLQLDGFASWQRTLRAEAGAAVDLGRITMLPAPGILALTSSPSGANVTLGGEFLGQTPLRVELAPGRDHRLGLSRPGYRRFSETVSLPASASEDRQITLEPLLGNVRFQISPPEAELRINGAARGNGSRTLALPAVAHTVEVRLGGYAPVRQQVTPRPGLEQLIDITLLTEREARMARIKPLYTNAVGLTLTLLDPASSTLPDFTMGSSRREPGRRSNETLRPVRLSRLFYLSTTEVTNAQFRLYEASHKSGMVSGATLNRDSQPVVDVSWQQAASYCNWLSQREGLPPFYTEKQGIITGFNALSNGYRLPTEAEWAWAARARGDTLLTFPWGDDFPPTVALDNYADASSAYITGRVLNNYSDGHVVSGPVGSYAANQQGLYDMGGNVAEWVHDVYTLPVANASTATDPLGKASGDNYVIRGAGWSHAKLTQLRLAHRDYGQAGRDDVGFRVARYAE